MFQGYTQGPVDFLWSLRVNHERGWFQEHKEHLWFSLRKPGERDSAIPCFWFEVAPDHYGYGMGCWEMPPAAMAKLRARIDRDPVPGVTRARAV